MIGTKQPKFRPQEGSESGQPWGYASFAYLWVHFAPQFTPCSVVLSISEFTCDHAIWVLITPYQSDWLSESQTPIPELLYTGGVSDQGCWRYTLCSDTQSPSQVLEKFLKGNHKNLNLKTKENWGICYLGLRSCHLIEAWFWVCHMQSPKPNEIVWKVHLYYFPRVVRNRFPPSWWLKNRNLFS